MCGIIKPRPNEVIISNNFQALEEAIDEIQETENIRNEKEFFDSLEASNGDENIADFTMADEVEEFND